MNETQSRYTTDEKLQIAETIFAQMGGKGRLKAMVGAWNFTFGTTPIGEVTASFRFKSRAKNGANHFEVTLNGKDLYDVKFTKIRKFKFATVSTETDLYSDMLKKHFETEAGLYLSL